MSEYKELKAAGVKDPCLLQSTHCHNPRWSLSQTILLLPSNTTEIKLYFFSCGFSFRPHITFLPQTVNISACIEKSV